MRPAVRPSPTSCFSSTTRSQPAHCASSPPLVPLSRVELPISRLNPVFDIEGLKLVLSTLEIAGISSSFLGGDIVMSLASRRDDIIAAVDFLVTGI